MSTEFALDLRLARKKSGLTQRDCAHLLDVHASKLSALEHGKQLPTLIEICTLSLIYGRSFESLFGAVMRDIRESLKARLETIPRDTRSFAGTFHRAKSLERLGRRLVEEQNGYGGA